MSDVPEGTSRGGSLAAVALAVGVLAVVNALWPAMPLAMMLGLGALVVGGGALAMAGEQRNVRTVAIIGACAGLLGVGVAMVVKPAATGTGAGGGDATASVDSDVVRQAVRDALDGVRAEQENSPAMAAARKKAAQVRCSANMRQIAQALMMYRNNYDDRTPDDLMLLEQLGMIRAKQFQSPMEGNDDNECDYYYVPYKRYRSGSKNWLLLWTDLAYTDGEGANVVYTDGHAEYLEAGEFKRAMARFVREYKKANRGEEPPVVEPK